MHDEFSGCSTKCAYIGPRDSVASRYAVCMILHVNKRYQNASPAPYKPGLQALAANHMHGTLLVIVCTLNCGQ